jgi:hypothetical protein
MTFHLPRWPRTPGLAIRINTPVLQGTSVHFSIQAALTAIMEVGTAGTNVRAGSGVPDSIRPARPRDFMRRPAVALPTASEACIRPAGNFLIKTGE